MSAADPERRAEELRRELAEHNRRYYVLDDPTVGDDTYDALLDEFEPGMKTRDVAALFDRLGMSMEEIETLRNVLTGVIEHAREQNDAPDDDVEAVGS